MTMITTPPPPAPPAPASTPLPAPATKRLLWRVLVRIGDRLDPSRPSRPLSWHLVTCADTALTDSHCDEGRRLLTLGGDPDGHCLLDGLCPRCDAVA